MTWLDFWLTISRVIATAVGAVVLAMWLAGHLGLADFRLVFVVPEATP